MLYDPPNSVVPAELPTHLALRALPAPDRAQVEAYRGALRRAVAGTSRGARFLAGYLATSFDRVAHNCALLAKLARGRQWLDVGGFGLEPLMLQQQGVPCTAHVVSFEGDLLGLDREQRIVNAADEMVHSIRVEPLDVERQPLPFADDSLQLVTCFELLEHLQHDPRPLLREVRRVLAADGVLWLSTPNILCTRAIVRSLAGKNPHENPRYHADAAYGVIHPKEYTGYELRELATGCGLEVLQLSSATYRSTGAAERLFAAGLLLVRGIGRRLLRWPHASAGLGENLVLLARRGGAERPMPLLFE